LSIERPDPISAADRKMVLGELNIAEIAKTADKSLYERG